MTQDIEVTRNGGIRLSVPVQPFSADPICPKCATPPPTWLNNLVRNLRGESPIASVGFRHCAGSLPPAEEVGGLQSVMTGMTEIRNACAGLERQHMHINCGRCGYRWLMECADYAA